MTETAKQVDRVRVATFDLWSGDFLWLSVAADVDGLFRFPCQGRTFFVELCIPQPEET